MGGPIKQHSPSAGTHFGDPNWVPEKCDDLTTNLEVGSAELANWRIGELAELAELASWRVGELANRRIGRVGELADWPNWRIGEWVGVEKIGRIRLT